MGYVFVARHRLDGSDYAIKVVPFWAKGGVDEPDAERVLREVRNPPWEMGAPKRTATPKRKLR